jgi:hypothetical protein
LPAVVTEVLSPGQQSISPKLVSLQDAALGTALPFTFAVEGAEAWVNVTASGSTTPATLAVSFDAAELQPGEYHGSIVVDVQSSGVQNDPLRIALELTVESVVTASPARVDFIFDPCEELRSIQTEVVKLTGTDAFTYTARIQGNPDWLTVEPETGTLPDEVTIELNPALKPDDIFSANLLVTVDLPPTVVTRVPIAILCANQRLYAPLISN